MAGRRRAGGIGGRLAALGVAVLAGCASGGGAVGFVGAPAGALGVKLLTPDVVARSCATSILGVPVGDGEGSVNQALSALLGRDVEANVVTDATVSWSAFSTLLYNRACVEVRGNLGRIVSTVTLPAHHADHQ